MNTSGWTIPESRYPAEHLRPVGGDAEAERLCDRAVREVPRGAGMGDEPAGAIRFVAFWRRRV